MHEFLVNAGMMFIVAITKEDDWSNWNAKEWYTEDGDSDFQLLEAMRHWASNEYFSFSQMASMSLLLTVANGKFCLLALSP